MNRRTRLLLGFASALLAVGLLAPSSALAVHVFTGSFGESGHGDGQLELAILLSPAFEPKIADSGLAVNEETHDVYVTDTGNGRVEQFTATGAFVRTFGTFAYPAFVAVDNAPLSASHGDVYVADTANNIVSKFDSSGVLITSWGVNGQLDGSSASGGPFTEIAGITVSPSGELFVYDPINHNWFEFAQDGTPGSTVLVGRESTPVGIATDSAGNLYKVVGNGNVEKFDSAGNDVGPVNPQEGNATTATTGFAIDPANDDIYTDQNGKIDRYDSTCVPSGAAEGTPCTAAETFGAGHLTSGVGLAVDSAHTVYVGDADVDKILVFPLLTASIVTTGEANPIGATSATLHGTVNPNGLPLKSNPGEGCFFEYDTAKYNQAEGPHGEVAPCTAPAAAEVGAGNAPVSVHAEVSALKTGTIYHFRLRAANASAPSEGEDKEFLTLGPAIKEERALQVGTTTAKIVGLINPHGVPTSFAVEYVSAADFNASEYAKATSVPVPAEEIGAATDFVEVAQQLSGLSPDTTYHFRLVAINPDATNQGPDQHFATFVVAPAGLPDARAYEMVTPAQKSGEPFPPEPSEILGGTCKSPRPACAPGAKEITMMPMQSSADGSAFAYEGQPFSAGLNAGANEYLASREAGGWGTEGLSSPQLNGQFKALSSDLSRGVLTQEQPATPDAPSREGLGFANLYLWQEGSLQSLISAEPPHRDPGHQGANVFKIAYEGANSGTAMVPGISHVLFVANDALTAASVFAPVAPPVGAGSTERGCNLGENCNLYEWVAGQLRLINVLPGNATAAPGAVIGSRPSNSEPPDVDHAISADGSRIFWSNESGRVFVRIDGTETQEIKDLGGFVSATPDGAKVLLDDGCLYDLQSEACEADLTLDRSDLHQGGFQGILGAAEDLSHVYFVDTRVLSGNEENANEEHAEDGKENLYAWSEGTTAFIGKLLKVDNKVVQSFNPGQYGDWTPSSARRTAQVSADGRYLAFMSQAPLTGYWENKVNGPGKCGSSETSTCFEVFAYDAATDSLACPSCNPSGERPLGGANLSLFSNRFSEAEAAPSPPNNLTTAGQGRLFFESQDTLSPRDENGHVQDVYEWEPQGVGSCERPGGCVFLISSGHDPGDAMFVNSTPSGNDAFFSTREQLLPRDKDDLLDIYDARVNGGIAEPASAACLGEACKVPSSAPALTQSPASATFSGPGNPKPAPKHKKHHKQKKHKKHKRAAKHNRGGHK